MPIVSSWIATEKIRPHERNPRAHSPQKIDKLARNIRRFGFINPIIHDKDGVIIAGQARWHTARQLKLPQVPVIRVEHLSEDEVRAYRIADNRLAELAQWDENLLRIEIDHLIEVDFEVDLTGFDTPEIDALLTLAEDPQGTEEVPPPPAPAETVSQPGYLWSAASHRILCGDSRDPDVVKALFADKQAGMSISDPPYNVPIPGHVCGNGRHRNFACACGEMSAEEFITFLREFLEQQLPVLMEGALVYVFMDWRHLLELLTAGMAVFGPLLNLCVWAKTNAGMGSFYRSQHELIAVFKKGDATHVNNVQLGKHGRHRTNVWSYAGMNSFGQERDEALKMHPTVKPTAMIADAIMDASQRGEIVLDSFLGSGTTLLAAEQTGRICYGIELDPSYVDLIVRRWESMTGKSAVHEASGLTFQALQTQRLKSREAADA
jgi:DNA modification methylase